jgi:hypothetical protein
MDKFLRKMGSRVYSAFMNGPTLNCRPAKSKQRLDFRAFDRFGPVGFSAFLLDTLAEDGQAHVLTFSQGEEADDLHSKLADISKDAITYERETGIGCLYVGFPVLHVPPNKAFDGKRVSAPVAFVPVALKLTELVSRKVELSPTGYAIPNATLVHWVEKQTGKALELPEETNDAGAYASELARRICAALEISSPSLTGHLCDPAGGEAIELLRAAVLGLYPLPSINVIRDLEAMERGEQPGAAAAFLNGSLATEDLKVGGPECDRLIAEADPSQAKAVRLARQAKGLVIHGPPGTGKSQTLTNVIGDHVARGKRVLMVCDKRTALEVVRNRLSAAGMDHLVATVFDPQKDQKDLYMSVRGQLDGVPGSNLDDTYYRRLNAADAELSEIHDELTRFSQALRFEGNDGFSFHDLMKEWLALSPETEVSLPEARLAHLDAAQVKIQEILDRGERISYQNNAWRDVVETNPDAWHSQPQHVWKIRLAAALMHSNGLDDTRTHSDIDHVQGTPAEHARRLVRAANRLALASRRPRLAELPLWLLVRFMLFVAVHVFPSKFFVEKTDIVEALKNPLKLITQFRQATERMSHLERFEEALASLTLLRPEARQEMLATVRQGGSVTALLGRLHAELPTVDGLVRIAGLLKETPPSLVSAVFELVRSGIKAQSGLKTLRKAVLNSELQARLHENPVLLSVDAHRIKALQDRYRAIQLQRFELVRMAALAYWEGEQREMLLAGSGTRLNERGAELKRRLMVKGSKAMKLREAIKVGQGLEGGDPLFALRPVWMCSPEAVAQIFPRKALFDVVIFDEASQLKLEEALPVLMRAERVVIAGDPQQLPPTRFFESAPTEDSQTPSEGADLFAEQQGEQEDLLSAALNLEIDQTYLDVHYRSARPELIEFSNQYFYNGRLQALPRHPHATHLGPAIKLVQVNGTYSERTNETEADKVVEVVADLLSKEHEPSIGIACFNAPQRDLIESRLAEQAAHDELFAKWLEAARNRVGPRGERLGLFVKNLENVQGDERDVMIISTTFGRDPEGKFKKQFGPLSMPGGGRRLNVLVTRAREQVYLVTSIPESEYLALPTAPQNPSGAYLLFAYLAHAAKLNSTKQSFLRVVGEVHVSGDHLGLHAALADRIAEDHGYSVDVGVGPDAFKVDLVLNDGRLTGVLCDIGDFGEDTVEWDVFRVSVLEKQGWTLRRMSTPCFFRNPSFDEDGTVSAAA